MSSQDNSDLMNLLVSELGRLSLLVEEAQASNLLLQAQIDVLKEKVAALERDRPLMKIESFGQDEIQQPS